jgi:hypothetical protein
MENDVWLHGIIELCSPAISAYALIAAMLGA